MTLYQHMRCDQKILGQFLLRMNEALHSNVPAGVASL